MMERRMLAGLVLLAGVCGLAVGKPAGNTMLNDAVQERSEAAVPLQETGSYVRRYWHIPLYRVTLEIPDPQDVASRYRKSSGRSLGEPDWNELVAFLLDPQNHIPVRLSIQMLIGLKGYASESQILRESFGRMGLEIDENWRIQGDQELQGEVTRFAEAAIGLSADRPGLYYRCRKKGDLYVFSLDGSGGAALIYQPAANNSAARPGQTDFPDHRVLAAAVGALLLPAPEEEGASSVALLKTIRDACTAWAAAEVPRPAERGKS